MRSNLESRTGSRMLPAKESDWQRVRTWLSKTGKKTDEIVPKMNNFATNQSSKDSSAEILDNFHRTSRFSLWLRPFLVRVALSIGLLAYVVCGAGVFMSVMEPSPQDLGVQEKLGGLRNDTAVLIANEISGQDAEKAAQSMRK